MGLSTLIGFLIGIGALGISVVMEGGELGKFLSPSAALIVFGGTIGATLVSYPLDHVLKLPSLILQAFGGGGASRSANEAVSLFANLAEKARKEGLLSLEEEVERIDDPFVKKGTLLVVDGIDPDVVRTVLDIDIAAMAERHQKGYAVLEAMGGYAPTMGIIGTVMGLVHVLGSLDNPSELGPAIAVAFIATFYGVGSANLIWLPLASKLKSQSKEEISLREVAREGILAVQAGDNPRIVREKLEAFLAIGERSAKGDERSAAKQPAMRRAATVAAGQR